MQVVLAKDNIISVLGAYFQLARAACRGMYSGISRSCKSTKMFLSTLASSGGCLKMPVDEQKTMNKAKNHARSSIFHYDYKWCVLQTTVNSRSRITQQIRYHANHFSCPGDCKELSKKTRQSTHNSNQARTKPQPTLVSGGPAPVGN